MFKYIIIPLFCTLVISLAIFWSGLTAGFSDFETFTVSILVFCGLLTLYNHIMLNIRLSKRGNGWRELGEMEKEVNERLVKLENRHGGQTGFSEHDERLNMLESRLDAEEQAKTLQAIEETETKEFEIETAENVVSLKSVSDKRQENLFSERRAPNQNENENIPKGLNLDDHFSLFLNPVFDIADRDIVSLAGAVGLYDDETKKRHVFRQHGLSLSPRTLGKLVIKSLHNAGDIMQEMEINDERVPLSLDITGALIGSKETWKFAFAILSEDAIFQKMFTAQITFKNYIGFSKAQQARVSKLREIGIPLAISDCFGKSETTKAIELGIFSTVSIPAYELMKFDKHNKQQLADALLPLANERDIDLIATNLENEAMIVSMLDHNLELVQGAILSKPLLAKTTKTRPQADEAS